jgi:hypothetical protein
MKKNSYFRVFLYLLSILFGQTQYNHPEINWQTFETDHFNIHFYDVTEHSAREGAEVAERVYPIITDLYDYEPQQKTHIIFTDVDDISNGAAYYYDNKIVIWTSPLDFDLRGSHRWLQNVITHEFTHIVSIQKAMKYGQNIPGGYIQFMGYEKTKRKDVLYGYPNVLISYPIPGTVVPPWLAEGSAQYMYDSADWDTWDTHRDMILRDRFLNDNLLTLDEMNTFGKTGIGNESIYNSGYAFCRFIAEYYGSESLKHIMEELSKPFVFSIHRALEKVTQINSEILYQNFKESLRKNYSDIFEKILRNEIKGRIVLSEGTANLYPVWAPDGEQFGYLSNKKSDFFSQTSLYVYNLNTEKDTLISSGVQSKAAWNEDGTKIFYSKKPKYPNIHGSKYFDLFQYDFRQNMESRLTHGSRGFSPVSISDTTLAYIATFGGFQNIYLFNLNLKQITQITDFSDMRIIHSLYYDNKEKRIIFDYTFNHFRDIGYYNIQTDILSTMFSNPWDERSVVQNHDNLIYSDDKTGIFNLVSVNKASGGKKVITNVIGGAFMPDINSEGQILYSLFENGKYSIALLNSIDKTEPPVLRERSFTFSPPIEIGISGEKQRYKDQFPPMFILPKIMSDYKTIKPGFYFYSSEILERLSVFGGASANLEKDIDLFFLFEFKRFYPTLFAEVFYLTRNKFEQNQYSVYPVDDNLKFRMIRFRFGARIPAKGIHSIESYVTWQRYRAFVKSSVLTNIPPIMFGTAYDYFRGLTAGLNWKVKGLKRRAGFGYLPSKGFEAELHLSYEHNNFITGLDFSNSGTLLEKFSPNHTGKVEFNGTYNLEIPKTDGWMLSTNTNIGYLSNSKVDSFFHFFGGGFPGMKGYPFYSIEGTIKGIETISLRIPILKNYNIPIGVFTFQNSSLGCIYSIGDAWRREDEIDWKQSAGVELRFNGFSFYNYPTAISMEVHRGLNSFTNEIGGETLKFGVENQFYLSILFGFNN